MTVASRRAPGRRSSSRGHGASTPSTADRAGCAPCAKAAAPGWRRTDCRWRATRRGPIRTCGPCSARASGPPKAALSTRTAGGPLAKAAQPPERAVGDYPQHAFTALNQAFAGSGFSVTVGAGESRVIEIVHRQRLHPEGATLCADTVHVELERDAHATVVERWEAGACIEPASHEAAAALHVPGADLEIAPGAVLHYYRLAGDDPRRSVSARCARRKRRRRTRPGADRAAAWLSTARRSRSPCSTLGRVPVWAESSGPVRADPRCHPHLHPAPGADLCERPAFQDRAARRRTLGLPGHDRGGPRGRRAPTPFN